MQIIFPLLLVAMFGPGPNITEQKLGDIRHISSAVGHKVELFRKDGTAQKGMLGAVSHTHVVLWEGATDFNDLAAADRLADGRWDGVVKGAMFGALMGIFSYRSYHGEKPIKDWMGIIGTYAAVGWAIDAAVVHREPLYRAWLQPAVKLSLRF